MTFSKDFKGSEYLLPVVVIIVLVVMSVGYVAYSSQKSKPKPTVSTLEATTYKNSNTSAKLKFIKGAKPVESAKLPSFYGGKVTSSQVYLVAPYRGVTGLMISMSQVPANTSLEKAGYCRVKAFTIKASAGKQSGPVCEYPVPAKGKPPVVYAFLAQGKKDQPAALVLVSLDYDKKKALTSKAAAKDVVSKLDLRPYNAEISQILQSIAVQ